MRGRGGGRGSGGLTFTFASPSVLMAAVGGKSRWVWAGLWEQPRGRCGQPAEAPQTQGRLPATRARAASCSEDGRALAARRLLLRSEPSGWPGARC